MSTIFYFAYGSNMSSRRLKDASRLPSAIPLGIGILNDYRLEFHKPSRKDGSGKCGVIESGGDQVHGVVFRIGADCRQRLDQIEGEGHGYEGKFVEVISTDGDTVSALTYCATLSDPQLSPYTWYMRHVLEGAREFKLPPAYVKMIETVIAVADPCSKREAMELAIYRESRGDFVDQID